MPTPHPPAADDAARERSARKLALGALTALSLLSLAYCFVYAILAGNPVRVADSLYWVVADWGIWFLLGPVIVRDVLRLHRSGGTRRDLAWGMLPRLAAYVALALAVRAGFELGADAQATGFLLFKRLPLFLVCALAFGACALWQVRPELVRLAPPEPEPEPAPPAPASAPASASTAASASAPAPAYTPERRALVVQSARGEHRLALADISHIEACGNYLEVRAGQASYLMRQTMKALEEQLAGTALVRCHRSYLVNLEHIDKLELRPSGNHVLHLRDGASIPLSKAYRDAVRTTMGTAPA